MVFYRRKHPARGRLETVNTFVPSAHVQVIPVDGIIELPEMAEQALASETLRERNELRRLNVATAVSIALVSVAWVLLALD